MTFKQFFSPPASLAGLPFSEQKRLPYLVMMNIILLVYFLSASFSRFRADPEHYALFFVLVCATVGLVPLILFMLHKGQAYWGSTLTSGMVMLNMSWTLIFVPYTAAADAYRIGLTFMGAAVANSLFSFRIWQLVAIAVASTLGFVVAAAQMEARFPDDPSASLANYIAPCLLMVVLNVVLWLSRRHADSLVQIAEAETVKNQAKLKELESLLISVEDSFMLGDILKQRTSQTVNHSEELHSSLDDLKNQAHDLASATQSAKDANKQLLDLTDLMKQGVESQNSALTESSASIQQITATLKSITQVARDREHEMEGIVQGLEAKREDIIKAREGMASISETSHAVALSARAIGDIAEKISLLAMNASIEAAHSGATGKGFAIIAGEMRKLASDTKTSSEAIAQAIDRNVGVVENSSTTVGTFITDIEQVTASSRSAMNGLREIMSGVNEISTGTQEMSEALLSVVDVARQNQDNLAQVHHAIESRVKAVEDIAGFATQLSSRTAAMGNDFTQIRAIISQIAGDGEHNIRQLSGLKSHLERTRET